MPDIDGLAQALLADLDSTWKGAQRTLHHLLDARLDELFKRMWVHLGTAAGLLLLILSVVYFVARQIALPIRRLADVADRVRSTGDYQLRAHWDSGDELGRLVNGFNGMLHQLNQVAWPNRKWPPASARPSPNASCSKRSRSRSSSPRYRTTRSCTAMSPLGTGWKGGP